MEQVLLFLYHYQFVLPVLAMFIFLYKAALVLKYKGPRFFYFLRSFMRIYSDFDIKMMFDKEEWQKFMRNNNLLNYGLYVCLVVFVFLNIIFKIG